MTLCWKDEQRIKMSNSNTAVNSDTNIGDGYIHLTENNRFHIERNNINVPL